MQSRVIAAAIAVLGAGLLSATLVRPTHADATVQASYRARVVGVYDGDTILVRREGQSRWQSIRMYGVDAPEYDPPLVQRFGYASAQFVANELMYEDVTVVPVVTDFYGRTVSKLVCPDGKLLQTKLLERGLGWAYRSYVYGADRAKYLDLEAIARHDRTGLWADQNPTPPWTFRHYYH